MKKPYYRCACCDVEFDSNEACREHFKSLEHNMVAIPAWIRCVASMHRGAPREAEEWSKKCFDDVAEYAVSH